MQVEETVQAVIDFSDWPVRRVKGAGFFAQGPSYGAVPPANASAPSEISREGDSVDERT